MKFVQLLPRLVLLSCLITGELPHCPHSCTVPLWIMVTLPSPSPYIQRVTKGHWVKLLFPYILNIMAPFPLCCFDACSQHSALDPWIIFLNTTPCPVFIPSSLPHCSHTNTKGNSDHNTYMLESISGPSSPEKKSLARCSVTLWSSRFGPSLPLNLVLLFLPHISILTPQELQSH